SVIKNLSHDRNDRYRYLPLVFSPDSRMLMTTDVPGKQIVFYDIATGKSAKKIAAPNLGSSSDTFLKLSHDQRTLVVAQSWGESMDVRAFDFVKGDELRSFTVTLPSPFGMASYQLHCVISDDCR